MKLYAQHGHGKSDKIDRAFESELLDGVILGPVNEKPESLTGCVYKYSELQPQPDVLIDPQVYVSLLSNPKEGNLPLYEDFYESNLSIRDFTPRRIAKLVASTINFQINIPVTHLVSPTILLDSFTNRSAQIAQFLAQESLEYHSAAGDDRPLLLSFVFNESALSSSDQVTEFLDTISLYTPAGFYLVVARSAGRYQQFFPWERMAEWLLILYSLGIRNRFDVVCGYTDFLGVPACAAGATAAATGWFNTLRQFEVKRFQPSTGGAPAKERYSSAPLLNSIFLQELINCYDAGVVNEVLTNTPYDRRFRNKWPTSEDWPADISTLHHWATLRQLFDSIEGKTRQRVEQVEEKIGGAQDLYARLKGEGLQFDPATGPGHLRDWAEGLKAFRALAGL